MQVFKNACKIILAHPIYLVIYIVVLSIFGLFLVNGTVDASEDTREFESTQSSVAIIDRDRGPLARGLSEELGKYGDVVEIEDNRQSLQDSVAQGTADYIVIINPGFSDEFVSALSRGEEVPKLETVSSYASIYAIMMDQISNQYLSLFSTLALAYPDVAMSDLTEEASRTMKINAQVEVESFGESEHMPDAFVAFLRFASYPLTVGIIVCVTMLMAAFNRGEVRRRNLASSCKQSAFNVQTALACLMIALFAWAWTSLLGFIAFGASLDGVLPVNVALVILLVLVFVTVPLALGYLFSQIGLNENSANAAGNILAMVLSFLGGAWIDLALLGSEVVSVAHFTPAFWYTDTLSQISSFSTVPSGADLWSVLSNFGIILLFSTAIFVVALVIGRMRLQSSEAGGNQAAARLKS